jgi:SAM-dependent methyltransferase
MSNNDWYRYYAPRRLPHQDAPTIVADRAAAEQDIEALLARTGLRSDMRILEIGCGWGRHALALAKSGLTHVRSIDIAPEPLQLAHTLARQDGLRCTFQQQDFMTVSDGPYDALISLYDRSVCGFPTEAEDRCSLHHLSGLLQPGGWLVFGINDWPFHLPEACRDWRETDDGIELIEVVPDRAAMTCTDCVTLVRPGGQREYYELTRRHYYLPELQRMLSDAGLSLHAAFHRLIGERPYGDGGNGLFIFARKTRLQRSIF